MLYNVLAEDIFILRNIRTKKHGYISVERKVPSPKKTSLTLQWALMSTYGVFVTYKITILTHEIPNILSGCHMYRRKWLQAET